MPTRHRMELGLYDARGHRKYVTAAERAAFLTAAEEAPREVRTLCGLLVHTGCRLSEALWLTADRVDLRADLGPAGGNVRYHLTRLYLIVRAEITAESARICLTEQLFLTSAGTGTF